MARVLLTSKLPEDALDPLASHLLVLPRSDDAMTASELADAARDVDAIVCQLTDRIPAPLFAAARRLLVVATVSVGYDNVDVVAATDAGVAVCNTPGVLDDTTADLAFALILAASRQLSQAERDLRQGAWTEWRFNGYLGHDVHGATLGLVGYGRIAQAVARRAEGFSMRVLHHSRRPTGVEGYVTELDDLLRSSDVVSLHVPLTAETRHLIDARRLALFKPTAVLVNTARGPVVDEEALAGALEASQLFAAGLDVYEHEPMVHPRLLAAPRTVLLPHIGSASFSTRAAMAHLATTAVAEVLAGRRPPNTVNPEVFAR
ncbi:MAG TPA: D-glycerate dehydrogenase [Acidimicrobiales bacterium]|nr:D-glycerate dehydrogenase [Acidimicrobiales bacterium]